MKFKLLKAAFTGLALSVSCIANAGLILHVADGFNNRQATGISGLLTADGHTVNSNSLNTNNISAISGILSGNLVAYDLIVLDIFDWIGGSTTDLTSAINSLSNYQANGGNLFFTGYDSARSGAPWGALIQPLIGASSGVQDLGASTGGVINDSNSLTTGLVDIRGIDPDGTSLYDYDRINSPLASDTVGVASSSGGGYLWTLRTPGAGGEIAYVSSSYNWNYADHTGHANALRNFAYNSSTEVPEPSTLAIFALGMIGLASRRFKKQS